MIADPELKIIYTNPAVIELLEKSESDLKHELPRFNMATLIGSNIDIFHKNPAHQRKMLNGMKAPHFATIRVGKLAFDLLVSPLFDGERCAGYVVEWSDAEERLKNVDFAGQIDALGRSQAMIEFLPDGTIIKANDNFLKTMGYTAQEVVGRHHSIFVEPDYRESTDYQVFWTALRRGEYQAAQFKRLAKNGDVIWLEASYNPIKDEKGNVIRVMKAATNITSQVDLLGNLKSLIDRNFGELDEAIALSNTETLSASRAAQATAESVQAVAASAEGLAGSIAEIARNMVKSRAATETAVSQSATAEENTAKLTTAAQAMNSVVTLIQNIASQINLLSLNATIEAARAGEAGKGFAVVASEVKNLAGQTAKATDHISREISGIQATAADVVAALGSILNAVEIVRDSVSSTASAIDEQNVVTGTMSQTMRQASAAVSTVTANVAQISGAIHGASQTVLKTREAAKVLVR